MDRQISLKQIFRIAGSFIAWVIGSGFATGQEILQFFSSYGYKSYYVVFINLIGFISIGYFLMKNGYEHKRDINFNCFSYYCGNRLGVFYTWLVTMTLLFLIPVLVAGGGATLYEYYNINVYMGSAIMSISVLAAYLIGFERMIKIVSSIGPLIIIFSFLIGIFTVFEDYGNWQMISSYEDKLISYGAAPHWVLSSFLYLGLNFFPSSAYFTMLGVSATSKNNLKLGAILGGLLIILSIVVVNTAIILNGDKILGLNIPALYLANKTSYVFGNIFSMMLILGIFSSCSIMMWSVCSKFSPNSKKGNVMGAIVVAIFAYILSLFSFGKLIATIYPIIGYIGLIFIVMVIYRGRKNI